MKNFNVTIINPIRNRQEKHMDVSADRINFDSNTFKFNNSLTNCKIVAIEEVSQISETYFNRFGTICE